MKVLLTLLHQKISIQESNQREKINLAWMMKMISWMHDSIHKSIMDIKNYMTLNFRWDHNKRSLSSNFRVGFLSLPFFLVKSFGLSLKQLLQTGLYSSYPPMSYISSLSAILLVKDASFEQYTHIADNLVTFYAIGNKLRILPKGLRWKVPSSAATSTVIPELARSSENSTI